MKLLIDIGNTRAKWALAQSLASGIQRHGVIDEDWLELREFAHQVESVWVSCVANEQLFLEIQTRLLNHLNAPISRVRVPSGLGILKNAYMDLGRLGVDRWVAALGARSLISAGPIIVVDAGTAATVDLVTNDNVFEGGVILPGIAMMHDSLVGKTAGIQSQRQEVVSVIGKNTQECVNSGALFGLVGAIERIVNEMQNTIEQVPELLITGGDARLVMQYSKLNFNFQEHLIFWGLLETCKLRQNQNSHTTTELDR